MTPRHTSHRASPTELHGTEAPRTHRAGRGARAFGVVKALLRRGEKPASIDPRLAAQQKEVQKRTHRVRDLDEYNMALFLPSLPRPEQNMSGDSSIATFCASLLGGERASLVGLLKGMAKAHPERPVRWCDMAMGSGVAMRQASRLLELDGTRVERTGVDLEDVGLSGLDRVLKRALDKEVPGTSSRAAAPHFVAGDMTNVRLPEKQDLITSVEGIQYLADPLRAFANWHNQLEDDGLLLVAIGSPMRVQYPGAPMFSHAERSPRGDMFQQLAEHGIAYERARDADPRGYRPEAGPDDWQVMIIQKKPHTSLQINAEVLTVNQDGEGGKSVTYALPPDGRPAVEVLTTQPVRAT